MLKHLSLFTFPTQFIGIFLLMLSTFLIGYFTSLWLEKNRNKIIIKKLKRKINNLKQSHKASVKEKSINNVDTIYTEIKPKKLKVINEAQENIIEEKSTKETIANKTRTNYITYTKSKPELDFNNFGKALESQNDDLTKLDGIGPYIQQRLNDIGIYNYDQVSKFTIEDIRKITELIDFFPGRIERDNWVGQAHSFKINQ
ncbi:MAG: putative flap endonuclease-1-like 5' DNA nuclease [Flavobacteriaceae bacterium]|jgi:predicted flap endonuclease-1-like 5' DNA nuclease